MDEFLNFSLLQCQLSIYFNSAIRGHFNLLFCNRTIEMPKIRPLLMFKSLIEIYFHIYSQIYVSIQILICYIFSSFIISLSYLSLSFQFVVLYHQLNELIFRQIEEYFEKKYCPPNFILFKLHAYKLITFRLVSA